MPKKILEGVVMSAKSPKTVIVRVSRRVAHPVYKKFVYRSSRFAAHDEHGVLKEGDSTKIMESRPFSKTKKWIVVT